MAINPRGYQEVAKRGSYGEGGLAGRAAITLTVEKQPLFKYIPEVTLSSSAHLCGRSICFMIIKGCLNRNIGYHRYKIPLEKDKLIKTCHFLKKA